MTEDYVVENVARSLVSTSCRRCLRLLYVPVSAFNSRTTVICSQFGRTCGPQADEEE